LTGGDLNRHSRENGNPGSTEQIETAFMFKLEKQFNSDASFLSSLQPSFSATY